MQFRCYSCGLKFSDGPPPLEALSLTQADLVGINYTGDPNSILCPALKDLSVYNFCSVCVQFARYQAIWDHEGHELIQAKGPTRNTETFPRCECGHDYTPPPDWRGSRTWIWINRAQRLHYARVFIPGFYNWDSINLTMEV